MALGAAFFTFSLVDNPPASASAVNQRGTEADSEESRNFRDRCALSPASRQRMAVMGSGDIVVGSKPTRKSQENPQAVIVNNLDKPVSASTGRSASAPGNVEQRCGAMSQQRCDSGAISTPQQFVHLVGCRDRKGQQQS